MKCLQPGGVASSKPVAQAIVGPGGLAVARPVATAIAGVRGGGVAGAVAVGGSSKDDDENTQKRKRIFFDSETNRIHPVASSSGLGHRYLYPVDLY